MSVFYFMQDNRVTYSFKITSQVNGHLKLNVRRRLLDFEISDRLKNHCEASFFCSNILNCHFRIVICQRSSPLFDIKVGQTVKNTFSATVVWQEDCHIYFKEIKLFLVKISLLRFQNTPDIVFFLFLHSHL